LKELAALALKHPGKDREQNPNRCKATHRNQPKNSKRPSENNDKHPPQATLPSEKKQEESD